MNRDELQRRADEVRETCVRATHVAAVVGLIDCIVALPIGLVFGRVAGRWALLPGMYVMSALLVAAGIGAWARLVVDAGGGAAGARRVLASFGMFALGLFWFLAGCGGLVALTVYAILGRS